MSRAVIQLVLILVHRSQVKVATRAKKTSTSA